MALKLPTEVHDPETGEFVPVEAHKNRRQDQFGRELVDPRPMAPPVGYKKQPSMVDHIRNMVRSEMLRQATEQVGLETFDEADDFDVGDDYDPTSPYEEQFDPDTGSSSWDPPEPANSPGGGVEPHGSQDGPSPASPSAPAPSPGPAPAEPLPVPSPEQISAWIKSQNPAPRS